MCRGRRVAGLLMCTPGYPRTVISVQSGQYIPRTPVQYPALAFDVKYRTVLAIGT